MLSQAACGHCGLQAPVTLRTTSLQGLQMDDRKGNFSSRIARRRGAPADSSALAFGPRVSVLVSC